MRHCAIITALLVLGSGSAAAESYSIAIEPSAEESLRSSYCPFADDDQTLLIYDGKNVLSRHRFCTSYGKAEVKVINDAKGTPYVLLRYGQGRGTNAVTEYLSVFRVAKNLVEYVRTPISSAADVSARWEFSYSVSSPPDGGLRIALTRSMMEIGGPSLMKGHEFLPPESSRVLQIGP